MMSDLRSKMASDIKLFMRESKILELKECVKVIEALPYMTNLTAQAQQKIERKIETHGECAACHILYEEVTRNPRKLFPELLAALKKTKQHDVYARFKATLHECRLKRGYKSLEAIKKLVKEEEVKKECDRDSCDSDSDISETGAEAHAPGVKGSSLKVEVGSAKVIGDCGQSVVIKREPRTPPLKHRPLRTDFMKVSPSTRYMKEESKSLSSLQAKTFNQLALSLQQENSEGEKWWNFFSSNSMSFSMTRKEQRDIERSTCEGKAFLDLLDAKDFGIEDLMELFGRHGMHHGIEILGSFQAAEVSNTTSVEPTLKLAQAPDTVAHILETVEQTPETEAHAVGMVTQWKEALVKQTKDQAVQTEEYATRRDLQMAPPVFPRNDICLFISLLVLAFAFLNYLQGIIAGHAPNIHIYVRK